MQSECRRPFLQVAQRGGGPVDSSKEFHMMGRGNIFRPVVAKEGMFIKSGVNHFARSMQEHKARNFVWG